ncbi:hypothetical protein [Paenibacillus xylaniclasticus]|uniref:hypothetical protein n=1 Tax=Paenibacillus xylaniclasticus TaxID=588083 RepID=UPI000FDB415D|nr:MULTISPECIES: hypothetical protein [Paenibacillus]GFN30954.1 hypothetical protein PCURB6_12140 [Paenibacillus curdlanolyticus]
MGFQPKVNAEISINGHKYTIGEHPGAPGVPYGQEGRQGTVYLLHTMDKRLKKALKVFRGKFNSPSLVKQTNQLVQYKGMTGLSSCDRFIVTPQTDADTIQAEPELLNAVIMPWVEGPTWVDVLLKRQRLSRSDSYAAAYSLLQTLVGMEQRGLAHCDLSASNVMLPMMSTNRDASKQANNIELIDLEQMFSVDMKRPDQVPVGALGYTPQSGLGSQYWGPYADRFAGAVLIMEMLGASEASFFENSWGESYFSPEELQTNCQRYGNLVESIRSAWGDGLLPLFKRTWESRDLSHCPTFGEWLAQLSKLNPGAAPASGSAASSAKAAAKAAKAAEKAERRASDDKNKAMKAAVSQLERARQLEEKGKLREALEAYRALQASANRSLAKELEIAIEQLEHKKASKGARQQKRREQASTKAKKWMTSVMVIAILGLIGFGGYTYFTTSNTKAKNAKVEAAQAEVQKLEKIIKERDKQIEELTKKLELQRKPLNEKSEAFIYQLSDDFEAVKKAAEAKTSTRTDPSEETFNASRQYMIHLFDFLGSAFNIDEYTLEQMSLVQGYYYPFVYNKDRNAQLNIKFFETYRQKFVGGNE